MLPNPEERKRLRQQKEEARLRKQAQTKKLLIRLPIAAAVLLACGILILSITRNAPPDAPSINSSAPSQETESTSPQETTQAPTLPPSTVIHFAAAGDLNVTANTVSAGGVSYDYTNTFMDVAPLLSDADIASINFEGNFYREPYGSSASAPQSMATALSRIGVDLVQMANSFSINRGLAGLVSSMNAVRSAGMESLGVYASNEAFKAEKGYTIRTVKGIKLAFVAFTKGMDGMALPEGSEDCVNVLYKDYDSIYQTVNTEKITSILSAVAKEEPDLVIALLHWGSEFNDTISSTQEKIKNLMFDNGVDAIIGTHSHYVQKMELNQETGQFIAYSLGDFFSDAQRAGSEYSVVLDLEITKDNVTGETRITNYSYTPIFTVHEQQGQPMRVLRLQEAIAAYENSFIDKVTPETYAKMTYALERIKARTAGE